MNNDMARISLCTILMFAVILTGCGKKDDSASDTEPGSESPEVKLPDIPSSALDKAKEAGEKVSDKGAELAAAAKEKTIEKYNDIAAAFQADQGKSIEEVTAQAKEMAADKLREIAQIYRDTITENRQKLRELTEKFVATPEAERLSTQAQKLRDEIEKLHKGTEAMKEKFQVYYDALKEKAGNVTGLDL